MLRNQSGVAVATQTKIGTVMKTLLAVTVAVAAFSAISAFGIIAMSGARELIGAKPIISNSVTSTNQLKTYLQGYLPNRTIVTDLMDKASTWVWWSNYGGFAAIPFGQDLGEKGAAKYVYDVKLSDGKTYPKMIMVRPNDAEEGSTNAEFDFQLPNKNPLFLKAEFGFKSTSGADFVSNVYFAVWDAEGNILPLSNLKGTSLLNIGYNGIIMADLSEYLGKRVRIKLSINNKDGRNDEIYFTKLNLVTSNDSIKSNSLFYPSTFLLLNELNYQKNLLVTNIEWDGSGGIDQFRADFGTEKSKKEYKNFVDILRFSGVSIGGEISTFDTSVDDETVEHIYPGFSNSKCLDSYGNVIYWGDNPWRSTDNPVWRQILKDQIMFQIETGANGVLIDEMMGNTALAQDWGDGWSKGCYEQNVIDNFRNWLKEKNLNVFKEADGTIVVTDAYDIEPRQIDYVHYGKVLYSENGEELYRDLFYQYNKEAIINFWTETINEARSYARSLGKDFYFTGNLPYDCKPEDNDGSYELAKLLDYITYEQPEHSTMELSRERWEGKYEKPTMSKHNPAPGDELCHPDRDMSDWLDMRMAMAYSSMAIGTDKFCLTDWNEKPATDLSKLENYHRFILTNTLLYENLNNKINPNTTSTGRDTLKIESYLGNENKRLIINLVNTNFNNQTLRIVPQGQFKITLNLPTGFSLQNKKAYLISPDNDQVIELPIKNSGNKVTFNIPSVYIYSVLIITEPDLFQSSKTLHEANLLARNAKWDDVYLADEDAILASALAAFNSGNYQNALTLAAKAYQAINNKIGLKDKAYIKIIKCERIKSCDPAQAKSLFYVGKYKEAIEAIVI